MLRRILDVALRAIGQQRMRHFWNSQSRREGTLAMTSQTGLSRCLIDWMRNRGWRSIERSISSSRGECELFLPRLDFEYGKSFNDGIQLRKMCRPRLGRTSIDIADVGIVSRWHHSISSFNSGIR
ncbi:MAG: hypothetical protein ACI87E_004643 [Mariniblastus sp.]